MGEIGIFGIKIQPLTKTEFLSLIESNLENGRKIVQSGVNAASIVEIVNNKELRTAILNSNLVNVDGMSVVWALRFLGYIVPERVSCPDLAEDIIALAESQNYSIFLLGTDEKSLLLTMKKLQDEYPNLMSNTRGLGLMCSFDLPTAEIRNHFREKCFENKLMILGCGEKSIRFRPPLNITESEIDKGLTIIKKVLSFMSSNN